MTAQAILLGSLAQPFATAPYVTNSLPPDLAQLAHEAGVLTSYYDIEGKEQTPGIEPLMAVLRALGVSIHSPDQAGPALRQLQDEREGIVLDPVLVHWLGESFTVRLRIPADGSDAAVKLTLILEKGGENFTHSSRLSELQSNRFQMPWHPPAGYHRLEIEFQGRQHSALVIAAPSRAESSLERAWGVFSPLYALRSSRNWGMGDFGDLAELSRSVGQLGGELVGTLPLYATFLDEPCDPSPYSPCSRLFWNEAFIHVESVPDWVDCDAARRLASSADFQRTLERLRAGRYVEHRAVMRQKRAVLELLCHHMTSGNSARAAEFRRVLSEDHQLLDYSRFRATMEKSGDVWQTWQERQKAGTLDHSDYNEAQVMYHAYVQWVTRSQLSALTNSPSGARLYLDLPLGVHPSGYDVYKNQNLFMPSLAAGAPPDLLFSGGQNWGFPPLNPRQLRSSHYDYVARVLRNTLSHAAALRVDHIMGLYRLFVIPQGAGAREGLYIRYAADEMFAVLLLEAHRSECRLLVGEDLGTVPDEVRREMHQRGLARMFVWQFELEPNYDGSLKHVPEDQAASINTHDMPTFCGYRNAADIDDRFRMGLLAADQVGAEKAHRHGQLARGEEALRTTGWMAGRYTSRSLLTASLAYLASSAARLVMVNLEDLWLEAEPQNVPGTYRERPNWMRKARYSLEKGLGQAVVQRTLKQINALRRKQPE